MTTALLTPRTDAQFQQIVDELTRRGFLAGGLGSAALLGLAACGSSGGADSGSSSTASAEWSFVDDLHRTVTLPKRPVRVAALNDAIGTSLWSAGLHVVAAPMQGITKDIYASLGATPSQIAGITRIADSDNADTYNLETLTAARPDLLVDNGSGGKLLSVSAQPTLTSIAPAVGINEQSASFEAIMASIHRLTAALGIAAADTAAQANYQRQAQNLQQAIKSKPGLRVAFCFAVDNGLDLEIVTQWPGLQTFAALGMTIIPATGAAGAYFETVSWENVADIPADLLVYVAAGSLPTTQPTWSRIPAVKAGQVLNLGTAMTQFTYASYAASLGRLTTAIGAAIPGTGPH